MGGYQGWTPKPCQLDYEEYGGRILVENFRPGTDDRLGLD
jgi:hypothetical protein